MMTSFWPNSTKVEQQHMAEISMNSNIRNLVMKFVGIQFIECESRRYIRHYNLFIHNNSCISNYPFKISNKPGKRAVCIQLYTNNLMDAYILLENGKLIHRNKTICRIMHKCRYFVVDKIASDFKRGSSFGKIYYMWNRTIYVVEGKKSKVFRTPELSGWSHNIYVLNNYFVMYDRENYFIMDIYGNIIYKSELSIEPYDGNYFSVGWKFYKIINEF